VQPTRLKGAEASSVPQTLAAVRDAIGAAPDEWLDLSNLLPANVFRDAGDHLVPVGCERIADALDARLRSRFAQREARP
jgi:hypothetical protein